MAKVIGLEKILSRMAKLPPTQKAAVAKQLATEATDLAEAQKRAAPVDPGSKHPGALRESVHAYQNPDKPLSWRILADAKDEHGKFIGSNVEAGHRAQNGAHVPGRPFFFPTYRARKKAMRRRMMAASRAALRQLYPV